MNVQGQRGEQPIGKLLFTAKESCVVVPKVVDCECTELVRVYREMLEGSAREPGEVAHRTKCGTAALGFKLPHVREVFGEFYAARVAGFTRDRKVVMALGLLQQALVEEKLSGVLLLARCARQLSVRCLRALAAVVDEYVHELAVCDALGLKVLFLCIKGNTPRERLVRAWKDAPSVWLRRSCCMAHLKAAKDARHLRAALEICDACVASPARALQHAVGRLLREAATASRDAVAAFVRAHLGAMSREALALATARLEPAARTALIHAFRRTHNLMAAPPRPPAPRHDEPVPTPPAPAHVENPFIRRRVRIVRGCFAGFSPSPTLASLPHQQPPPKRPCHSGTSEAKDAALPEGTPGVSTQIQYISQAPYPFFMIPGGSADPVASQQPTMMVLQQNWLQTQPAGGVMFVVQPEKEPLPPPATPTTKQSLWSNASGHVK